MRQGTVIAVDIFPGRTTPSYYIIKPTGPRPIVPDPFNDSDTRRPVKCSVDQIKSILTKMPDALDNLILADGELKFTNGQLSRYTNVQSCKSTGLMPLVVLNKLKLHSYPDKNFYELCQFDGATIIIEDEQSSIQYIQRFGIANVKIFKKYVKSIISAISGEFPTDFLTDEEERVLNIFTAEDYNKECERERKHNDTVRAQREQYEREKAERIRVEHEKAERLKRIKQEEKKELQVDQKKEEIETTRNKRFEDLASKPTLDKRSRALDEFKFTIQEANGEGIDILKNREAVRYIQNTYLEEAIKILQSQGCMYTRSNVTVILPGATYNIPVIMVTIDANDIKDNTKITYVTGVLPMDITDLYDRVADYKTKNSGPIKGFTTTLMSKMLFEKRGIVLPYKLTISTINNEPEFIAELAPIKSTCTINRRNLELIDSSEEKIKGAGKLAVSVIPPNARFTCNTKIENKEAYFKKLILSLVDKSKIKFNFPFYRTYNNV